MGDNKASVFVKKTKEQGFQKAISDSLKFLKERPRYHIITKRDNPIKLLRLEKRVRRRIWRNKYTDTDPYKLLWVDPNNIIRESPKTRPIVHGLVEDGDWDRSDTLFSERVVYNSLKLHIEENIPLRETEYYDWFVNSVVNNGGQWGYHSESDFPEREIDVRNLIKRIESDGYHSQRDMFENNRENSHSKNNDAVHPLLNEVHVDIARDGEILYRHVGQHRLSIAKVLDVDKIPVLVASRHCDWQTVRDEIRKRHSKPLSHPDILDLL